MSVLVHAEIHGLAGRVVELRDVLLAHAEALAAAEGCLGATASERLGPDRAEFVLEVEWSGEDALRTHYGTTEYSRYSDAISPLLARPSDVRVHYVDRTIAAQADLSADPTRQG
jgi:quinol monooxygenase YgiN